MHRRRRRLAWISGAAVLFVAMLPAAHARRGEPVIDMHMHARPADYYGPPPVPICAPVERMPRWDNSLPIETAFIGAPLCDDPVLSPMSDEALMNETIAVMERRNIFGVLGGEPERVKSWSEAAPKRFIRGLDLKFDAKTGAARHGRDSSEIATPQSVRAQFEAGAFAVLGEVMPQYAGIAPDDPRLEPWWALAEDLDIPVGVHIGGGGPGEPYLGAPAFRARLQSALVLEDVLIRHPRLRIYIMHAGYPMAEDLLALLFTYPQVYVEVSTAVNVETRAAFYRFLKPIVEAGYAGRVMFGSDQIIWPGIIEPGIETIEKAPFLSKAQKRDVLYNNAARFLRLSPEEIARHHAGG